MMIGNDDATKRKNNGMNNNNNSNNAIADLLGDVELEQVALVAKELRENLPKYVPLFGQFGGKFASTLLERASSSIDSTIADLEKEEKGSPGSGNAARVSTSSEIVRTAARSLSYAASEGADAIKKQSS